LLFSQRSHHRLLLLVVGHLLRSSVETTTQQVLVVMGLVPQLQHRHFQHRSVAVSLPTIRMTEVTKKRKN
jgi:hypothetical protein